MQFSDVVKSVTRETIVPTVYDTVTKGSPVLMVLLRNAKPWRSGFRYDVPIKYQQSTVGGVFGLSDKLPSERSNTRVKMQFEPKGIEKPIVLGHFETTLNAGDEQVIDLLTVEFDSVAQDLISDLANELYTGTGVGDRWDSLSGAADDATNYGTYGNLSRTTYPTIKGYYLGSAGAVTLAKFATAYDAVTVGTESPDIIATSKSIWSTYEALLQATVHYNTPTNGYAKLGTNGVVPSAQALQGGAGFDALYYRGAALVKDEQIPSGKVFFINSKAFGFMGIDLKSQSGNVYRQVNFKKSNPGVPDGVPGKIPSTRGFNFRDMMSPTDQLAEVGYLIYAGNFIATNPRLIGQLTGAS